jgi:hypothetical protein
MQKFTVEMASAVVLRDYRLRGNDSKLLKRTTLHLRGNDSLFINKQHCPFAEKTVYCFNKQHVTLSNKFGSLGLLCCVNLYQICLNLNALT